MQTLIYSAIRTPDGTILQSRNRHDFISYTDKNGETYMIDGGLDYRRQSINKEPATDISVCLEDGHEKVREVLTWGTYGKSGEEPLRYILLKYMESDHIRAVLDLPYINVAYRTALKNELNWRNEK